MDLETEKDKYCMISLICESTKYHKLVNQIRNRLTDIERKLVITSGEREGGRSKTE